MLHTPRHLISGFPDCAVFLDGFPAPTSSSRGSGREWVRQLQGTALIILWARTPSYGPTPQLKHRGKQQERPSFTCPSDSTLGPGSSSGGFLPPCPMEMDRCRPEQKAGIFAAEERREDLHLCPQDSPFSSPSSLLFFLEQTRNILQLLQMIVMKTIQQQEKMH